MNKHLCITLTLLLVAVISAPAWAGTGVRSALKGKQALTFESNSKNQLEWLSEAPGEKIRGSAPGLTGQVMVDPADLSTARGKLVVPVATMKTGNDTRDRHLRGRKWLDAKSFPNIEFDIQRVTAVKADGTAASFTAHGKFKLHGVSQAIAVPIQLKWKDKGAGAIVKITLKFKVALARYKIEGKRGVVGDKVGKEIEIWGTLYGAKK